MKKITLLFALVGLLAMPNVMNAQKTTLQSASILSEDGTIRCASDAYHEELLQKFPNTTMTIQEIENNISRKLNELENSNNRGGVIRLPVVVHVVHNGESVGVGTNISDLQVFSQIDVLNEDYRRVPGSRGFGAGVDTNIEFFLAKEDPNCNPTTGIVRYRRSDLPNGGSSIDGDIKPKTIWDPSRYLNMWVVNIGGGILGYATFPGGDPSVDGVVMGPQFFGSNDAPGVNIGGAYNLGRTTTHEVGHYLGLFHTFQGCTGAGDGVADTPPQAQPNYGCPGTPPDTCPGGDDDLIENYMDYSDDVCMDMFTAGQNARMQAVLSGLRSSLANSTVPDTDLTQASNDASINVWCFEENCGQVTPTVRVGNFGTAAMTSATITYNINGGTNQVFNWSGNLTNGQVALVDLPPYTAAGTDTFNVSISAPGTDERSCNDSYSEVYTAAPVASYATSEVNLILNTDRWSSETTWEFANSSGTILYSGGPYGGTGAPGSEETINETFDVVANECYTFTINDSYGDGICCAYGNGSYQLTTSDGTIIINSNGQFGGSESTAVAALSLSTGEFFVDNGISIYPNPTTSQLTIKTANTNALPDSFEVYNILGQNMLQKSISSEADLNLDTSGFSNGIYFIKINKDDASLTLRFVKQ